MADPPFELIGPTTKKIESYSSTAKHRPIASFTPKTVQLRTHTNRALLRMFGEDQSNFESHQYEIANV